MHGETASQGVLSADLLGLSPHARGNPGLHRQRAVHERTIPACTGKPERQKVWTTQVKDYPRMHGETFEGVRTMELEVGLSPHARGNL